LKDYLAKGYALDKRRLEDQTRQLDELKTSRQTPRSRRRKQAPQQIGFNNKDLYPSIEEKAAHLLYFKN